MLSQQKSYIPLVLYDPPYIPYNTHITILQAPSSTTTTATPPATAIER